MTAFYNTPKLECIDIPNSVESISDSCFELCGVKELVIPDKVTELSGNMFSGCSNLVSVKLPSSLSELSKKMFFGCSPLSSISIPRNITFIPSSCFRNCFNLSTISLPPYLTYIADDAFINCKSIKKITIPEGAEIIYAQAFYGCSIDELKLPSTLKEVGGWSFGLGNMDELTLPVSLNKIGSYAFDDCVLNKVICLNPTPANCEENAFKNETYYGKLIIPLGSGDLYKSTKPWNNFYTIEEPAYTGIADTIYDSNVIPISYSNLLGVSQDRPFTGINIVTYSNGEIKKIRF